MNSEAVQKPVADEGADDANRRVADETETVTSHNLARQPSGNEPDDQNDNEILGPTDACSFSQPFALIRGLVGKIAKKSD